MSEVKRYAIYSGGKWEAVVVKVGPWVKWRDFDAQRLRADTAEAERDAAVCDANEAERKLAAAEQRIAELVAAFTPLIKNWDDLAAGESLNVDRARASLNPNPEAESHE